MKALGLTDGSAGMAAQVRALAHAMGYALSERAISVTRAWHALPNHAYDLGLAKLIPVADELPDVSGYDIVISCGRKAALVAASLSGIRKLHIQDPQMSPKHFDVVVAMAHDKIDGANVIKTRFALHSITLEKLAQARAQWEPMFAGMPRPHQAVLFGGSTNKYQLTTERMQVALNGLSGALSREGGSLLITPSRRTGAENIRALHAHFSGNPNVYIYDGVGDNPYMGMLACADKLTVTNDSVNMMTEAYITGKPLHILRLCCHENTKPARFAEQLVANSAACWLSEGGAKAHTPEDEMASLAKTLSQMLA